MTWLDVLSLAVALALVVNGLWTGGVRMVFGLAGLVLAYLFAGYAAPPIAGLLTVLPAAARHPVAVAAGFVLIFTAVVLAGLLANKMVETSGLSPLNRILGAVLGLVIAVYLTAGLARVAPWLDPAFQETARRSPAFRTLAACALFVDRLLPTSPPTVPAAGEKK